MNPAHVFLLSKLLSVLSRGYFVCRGWGNFVVAAVHIPLHESKYSLGKYCDVLDSLLEVVQRLQLQYKVP